MERYVLEAEKTVIEETFEASSESESLFEANYNVIGGSPMPIVIKDEEERKVVSAIWGLKRQSGDDLQSVAQEEVLKDDELKKLVSVSPCIIPASGFYKWKKSVKDPLPFLLRVIKQDVMSFAGLCTITKDENGKTTRSFAVITMPANALVEPLHQSMPVILEEKDFGRWLSGHAPEMLRDGFEGNHLLPDMTVFRVPELVNDPSNNSKELIQPIPKLRNYED
ncbi:SOS response-associated peptidase [Gracilimonas mengyeensis]|uniref:Abasic site processing protein n=1 Tax=Gracilimonas mengyeensis TaxID=1302730 RepID=A0A521CPH9_9BACT|nr:SOS response-associated peptidase family protein [Gracilimonas mengyeensis]SMO61285.1 Putative SOS response-associated peptidase YedK [Gracilimonas mengyeensis]